MKQGDFTKLAKDYINRTGYSLRVLKNLASYIGAYQEDFKVADIGAGTGKLTENLIELGLTGYSVEPNDSMREEGMRLFGENQKFVWSKGTGEESGLADNSVDWVLMASSFHWTKPEISLKEFHRILRPGGFLTVLWNPRDLESSELHMNIEKKIFEILPTLNRVSSGSKEYTKGIEKTLVSTGRFHNLIFMEAPHEVMMEKERYMGAWKSVNDIQAQAGAEKFEQMLKGIAGEIEHLPNVVVPYKTRAWTVQAKV